MIETELHDLSDDADYAASQQQGSQSMMRSDSGRRSEPEGSEIVYMKDNVSIHPTQYMSERISGRLKLVKQGDSLFMTWIPYKGQNTNARLSERDRNLYTIRPLPFTDVRSIRRHTPPLGWQYIIVVLSSGLAFPPLYFYNGGVKEFLTTIKQHVSLVRSADDANVFIVNDFQDPLQKTLSSLELPGVVSVAAPSTNASAAVSPTQGNQGRTDVSAFDSNSSLQSLRRQRNKSNDPTKDLSIQVLEKFSLVTKFARETTSQLFGESSGDQLFSNDLKKHSHSQSLPDLHSQSSNDLEEVPCEAPVPADPMEWLTFLDSEGRVVDSIELRKRIFYGGVVHELRKEVWPFLLGCYDYNSTYAEREYLRSVRKQDYEIIKLQWQSISPEQAKRFTKFRERKGLIEKDVVRTDRSFSFYDGDDNPNVNLLHDILLTYSFYNFDLGYCQGMSDYLSPLLFVMEDEFEVFWCFAALMERVGPNFNRDQSGMHAQLFALSKSLPVKFLMSAMSQTEMRYEETMRLWEILWTHYPSEHLHLYICVAILKRYRNKIIGEQMDFDTLLKFINGLSGQIDLDSIVRDAEALCICAGETGEACIPPGTPPSLPVENGLVSSQLEDEVL
uniref:Rab-GAP TBC domain-containing protein n=1 Tax=Chenopodium quinoa TaxID=63459 RepID=A0A803LH68_CHEQI